MALTATIYTISVQLSDSDRGVYETLDLRMARQPSETPEFMVTRLLAYCLEYTEGIEFTEGIASGDEPAVIVRDLTGRVAAWIEVGMPGADRLHRGSKLAGRAAVYTHRDLRQLVASFENTRIHKAGEIPLYSFDPGFIEGVAEQMGRRTDLALTITGGHLFADVGGKTLDSAIHERRLAPSA